MSAPVVLFDLDGTVLTFVGPSPGPGRTALDRAMRTLHGLEDATSGLRIAGGTDLALAKAMLGKAGVVADVASVALVLRAYEAELEAILRLRSYRAVGDVAGAVAALRGRGAVVGIATGNTRRGAALKLGSAGLSKVFDGAPGGYGCEAEARARLVQLAIDRCPRAPGAVVVVVGDTVQDVMAARDVGARAVGVAISEASRAELVGAGADAIVDACGPALVEAVTALAVP